MALSNYSDADMKAALRKPRTPGQPLSAAVVRAMARQARCDRFYRKLYALQLFMSGEFAELAKLAATEGTTTFERDEDLGLYPEIDPELGDTGVQNHGLINSRINIQSIAFSNPEFVFRVDDPLIREVLSEYCEQIWEFEDLSGKSDEAGMDLECMGLGFFEWGMEDGGVSVEPFSPLDALFDRTNRTPSKWRFFFVRRRLDLHSAFERFGHLLSYDTIERLATDVRPALRDHDAEDRVGVHTYPIVPMWNFWHKDTHCVFLGTINGGPDRSVLLRLNASLEYEVATEPGPNPFPVIPVSKWIDSWSPGVVRPVGKTETTTRMAGLLNRIEAFFTYCIDRGLPLTILSSYGLSPETVEKLKGGQQLTTRDLDEVIVVDSDDASKAVTRIPGLGIPSDMLAIRSVCKEELNAATGVRDSQRGVIQPGERTAQEARDIVSSGGVQANHNRKQFQKFLREGFRIAFAIGAQYESRRRVLMLSDGPIDTAHFPLRPLLSLPVFPDIREDSLQSVSQDERKQRRMIEFQTIDLASIDAGVGDPMKIFYQAYRDLGVKDPYTRLMTPEQYQQALMARLAAQQGANNGSENGTGGGSPDSDGDEPEPDE